MQQLVAPDLCIDPGLSKRCWRQSKHADRDHETQTACRRQVFICSFWTTFSLSWRFVSPERYCIHCLLQLARTRRHPFTEGLESCLNGDLYGRLLWRPNWGV